MDGRGGWHVDALLVGQAWTFLKAKPIDRSDVSDGADRSEKLVSPNTLYANNGKKMFEPNGNIPDVPQSCIGLSVGPDRQV